MVDMDGRGIYMLQPASFGCPASRGRRSLLHNVASGGLIGAWGVQSGLLGVPCLGDWGSSPVGITRKETCRFRTIQTQRRGVSYLGNGTPKELSTFCDSREHRQEFFLFIKLRFAGSFGPRPFTSGPFPAN